MVKDAVQSNFKEFTFSTWIKTSFGLKRYRLFTYTLGENSLIELGLKIRTSPGENSPLVHTFVLNGSDPSKNILSQTTSFQPINDNVWHHVALTWSEDGEWMTFVDGKLLTIRNHSSLEIPGGGVIYIGKAPGKSVFKDDDGFVGELSRLNFWNHMLSGEKIEQMALSSNNDSGNIIRWSKLLDSTFGKVKMIKPSTAVNSEKELDFQIHFPVSNSSLRSSFISWPVTKALDSLAVCFWIKIILSTSNNTDDFTFISHHSDAGDKDYFEYGVHLQNEYRLFAGINGTKIRSSEKGETGTNGEWHFNCMSWNGKSGDVVFFHDGIPLGHKRTDGSLRAVLPSVGNISFGSKWKYNGSLRVNELTYGKIAYLNVWSYTLPERAVLLMSAGGLNINGDVMAWKHVQKWIVGYLPVVNRTVIYFPGYSVLKRRTEWCYSHVNNVNAACGSLYARLGNNRIWKSMQWRCYCENVLVCSKFTYKMEVKYKHLSVNVDDKFMYSHHRDLIRIN
ncbi:uncharacterized protein LOC114533843 [Dendronephthya gigantea]|uniref:uncharacterized protein LOC114533843 n=1 Tax=Dendronephthya gigantea TaxID=151771 RepID=UPI00106B84AC|nr:uncharacterized protein LOC114533843 [Dendronephthya gigantea]